MNVATVISVADGPTGTPGAPAAAVVSAPAPATRVRKRDLQLDFLAVLDGTDPPAMPVTPQAAPARPTSVVNDREARLLLGIGKRGLAILVDAGVLVRPSRGVVTLPTGIPPRALFAEWAQTYTPAPTRRAVNLFVHSRETCGGRAGDLPPDDVLLACGTVLLRSGGTHRADELAALLRIPARAARAAAQRLTVLVGAPWDADATAMPDVPWTMDMMVAAVPALAGAPKTCLDPNPKEDHEEPGLRSRSRLAATGPLAGPAALFMIIAAASMRRESQLEHHMIMVQRFAHWFVRLFPRTSIRDAAAIAAVLEHIAFSPELDALMPPGVRDMACRSWLMLTDVDDRYTRGVDPTGALGLLALVPARHPQEADFRQRLRDHFRRLRVAAREKRKARTDPLADTLSEKCGRFWERMEQIGTICDAARIAAGQLLGLRRPGQRPCQEFLVRLPVLHDNGRHVSGHADGHEQEDRWLAWPEDDFRVSVGLPRLDQRPVQENLPLPPYANSDGSGTLATDGDVPAYGSPRAGGPRIIYERLTARATLGDRVVKPFFVTLADCGALARPTGLDARTLRKRQTLLRTWQLPSPTHLPPGLLWFDAAGEELWRRAVACGRSIVPLEEFETGVLFPELGVNSVLESLCRGTAFMQQEQNQEAWPTDDSEIDNVGLCFAAIDKTPAGKNPEFALFPVLDQTLLDAMEIAARVAKAAGRTDGIVPDVLIEESYRWKRPHPRPYVFQWAGEALRLSHVHYMLRVLFANIADISFHDLRHACAADLFDMCRSPEVVKRALGHAGSMWRYYARLTARMKRRDQKRRQQERAAELADKDQELRMAA